MTPVQKTLLAIGLFMAVALGTFIYFIANYDASKAQPIGAFEKRSPFISPDKPRGSGGWPPVPQLQPGHPA
ncbi:MAG: hypothetical protein AAGL96_19630 [Pseudomonadota bacterium]